MKIKWDFFHFKSYFGVHSSITFFMGSMDKGVNCYTDLT